MSEEVKSKKSSLIYRSFLIIAILTPVVTFIFGKYYFTYGNGLTPLHYPDLFYSWRRSAADASMFSYKYNKQRLNEVPEGDTARLRYCKHNNDLETTDLLDNFPEHYPRSPTYYYTHDIPGNKEFLQLRKNIVQHRIKDWERNEIKEIASKTKKPFSFDMKLNGVEKADAIDYRSIFDDNKTLKGDVIIMLEIIILFSKEKMRGGFKDGKLNEDIWNELGRAINSLSFLSKRKISKKNIEDFLISNGRATATIWETFIYSRFFYMFYFFSLNVTLVSNNKDQDRIDTTADCFSQLFINIYCNTPAESYENDTWLKKSLFTVFGYKRVRVTDQTDNLKKIVKELENVKKICEG